MPGDFSRDRSLGLRPGLTCFGPLALIRSEADGLSYSRILGKKKLTAFGELFGDEIAGGRVAFFPGFEKDGEDDEERGGGVGENDGRSVQKDAVSQPEEDAGEIEDQHSVGEIAAALFLDFDQLRDKGERGAEAGDGAKDFDRLRGEHVVEVS